ncbi:MAG: DUF4902 domain-containing protein [Methylovulum sp.]|nr:DUF4902 domain-containing protein [Methylovulum sp.]
MSIKNITGVNVIADSLIITICPDGYMRLTFEEFQHIPLVHLMSGLDEDNPALSQEGAVFAEMTGYTEWVSTSTPTISIGWDWTFQFSQAGQFYYKRSGKPRSNLMLVDEQQHDLGQMKSDSLIESVVDRIVWQTIVQDYISARYAS